MREDKNAFQNILWGDPKKTFFLKEKSPKYGRIGGLFLEFLLLSFIPLNLGNTTITTRHL